MLVGGTYTLLSALDWSGLTGTGWGGTDYLEDHALAHSKYRERLIAWADSPAFATWARSERDRALADADYTYASTGSAAEYWAAIPVFWEQTYPGLFVSLAPEQYTKIVAAVGASSSASDSYKSARDPMSHVEFDLPELPSEIKLPWYVWAGFAFVVFRALR